MSPSRAVLLLTLSACSTGSAAVLGPAPPAGSVTPETTGDGGADAGLVNGCDTYEDLGAEGADRTIVWIRTVGRKCLQIKKGQTITWDPQETFDSHPLRGKNGDPANPIAEQKAGTAKYVATFTGAGIFGFVCGNHSDMTGAIKVIE